MGTIARIRGIQRLTSAELHALDIAGDRIGCPDDDLAACIGFETGGTWRTSVPNYAGSGAIGLIQFMPQTAINLGTTVELLAKMGFVQQLEYVVKYFKSFRRQLDTLEKLYCAIFWPAAIDHDDDYVIGRSPSKVYSQNIGFDRAPRRGYFTRGDIVRPLRALLAEAQDLPRIELPAVAGAVEQPADLFTEDERREFLNLVFRTGTQSLRGEFDEPAGNWISEECPHVAGGLCMAA